MSDYVNKSGHPQKCAKAQKKEKTNLQLMSVLPAPLEYRFLEYCRLKSKGVDIHFVLGDSGTSISKSSQKFARFFNVTTARVFSGKKFHYQTGTVRTYLAHHWDVFFIQANFRYLDFWAIITLNIFLRRKVIVHGQGLFRHDVPGLLRSLAYRYVLAGCDKYLFYNKFCMDDFFTKIELNDRRKLAWANNVIRLKNPRKTATQDGLEIVFIGRLREGNGLQEFLGFYLRSSLAKHILHVIGGGEKLEEWTTQYKDTNIRFHGPVVSEKKILDITKDAIYGVYPGNAGLSVYHYAGLGLIPFFHDRSAAHHGPEFAYFDRLGSICRFPVNQFKKIETEIEKLDETPERRRALAAECIGIYQDVQRQSFGEIFAEMVR